MKQAKMLYNGYNLGSTTINQIPQVEIPAGNIEQLGLAMQFYGTGTTADTLANLLGSLGDMKLIVGGAIQQLIGLADAFALNYCLTANNGQQLTEFPDYLLSTTVDDTVTYVRISLPMMLTTDKKVYWAANAGTIPANTDVPQVDLVCIFGDKPFMPNPVSMFYQSVNTGTAYINPVDISQAGRKLIGLMIYSTTIYNGTTYDASAGEILLLQNRITKIDAKWISLAPPSRYVESTALQAILDHYRYIDFSDDPIPADYLQVQCKSIVSATDAVRFIGIYQ